MTDSVPKPTIQDHDNTYELNRVDDEFGNHFIIKGNILINPKVPFTITLSGLEELDKDSLTTIVHPDLLKHQPNRVGDKVIYFPINSKLDVCIHIMQEIDDDFINNVRKNVNLPPLIKDEIKDKHGWLACNAYEVIGKSNNSVKS